VSQKSDAAPPFRVIYSELCREHTRQLLELAQSKGQFAEVAKAIQEINTRLEWIPMDFGEPLWDFLELGIQERLGTVPPLVVRFGVDETRRLVYVSLPFKTLSNITF
jgi:hypothetical protein